MLGLRAQSEPHKLPGQDETPRERQGLWTLELRGEDRGGRGGAVCQGRWYLRVQLFLFF